MSDAVAFGTQEAIGHNMNIQMVIVLGVLGACILSTQAQTVSGQKLEIGSASQVSGTGSSGVGTSNSNAGDNSSVVGVGNSLAGSAGGNANASFVAGRNNQADATSLSVFVAGEDNAVTGGYANATAGRGLINQWAYSTVVGSYNDTAVNASPLFVVGNGTDATHRSNVFEVYASGKIQMPRQGDILMGEFGNTGD
jgi:hypothetical protein